MPKTAKKIECSEAGLVALQKIVFAYTSEQRMVRRAKEIT